MISFIRGKLLEKDPTALLIDVGGIGYEVFVPMTTFYTIGEVDSEINLYIHFVVREDAQQLYGFKSKIDKKIFQQLIKISGVGARTALAILSSMDCKTLLHCIENKDYNLLVKIPGIGKKTAERLVIEIYDSLLKLTDEIHEQVEKVTKISNIDNHRSFIVTANPIFNEAVDALLALGYKQKDAEKMVKNSIKDSKNASEAIRRALKGLY